MCSEVAEDEGGEKEYKYANDEDDETSLHNRKTIVYRGKQTLPPDTPVFLLLYMVLNMFLIPHKTKKSGDSKS